MKSIVFIFAITSIRTSIKLLTGVIFHRYYLPPPQKKKEKNLSILCQNMRYEKVVLNQPRFLFNYKNTPLGSHRLGHGPPSQPR